MNRMRGIWTLLPALLLAVPAWASDGTGEQPFSHEDEFRSYRGTRTCLKCHKEEAEAFFHSQHYQWRGDTPDLVGVDGEPLGKMNMINDFCTNPVANWIGKVQNADGKTIAKGCSACHASNGLMPSEEMTREQLENIDCLVCHNQGYRKDLYATEDGGWEWKPILWKNREGMDIIAKRISLPQRGFCLRCHSSSGGGPNWKRGDLEYVLNKPDKTHDVHMAVDGPDMACTDCHAGDDHRVVGRGVDLAATDSPDQRLNCTSSCHDQEPHEIAALDRHTAKVDCTVCHVPTFAREEATDMRRDWSNPIHLEEANKYRADITLEQNVEPVYAWFNGKSRLQVPGTPVRRNADGAVVMAEPMGERSDPDARLHAFKLHTGKLPVLTDERQWLLPIGVEEFFAQGDIDHAVREASKTFYGLEEEIDYEWTEVIRYMGIYHGVVSDKQALQCLDCHRPDGRMDWQALGYDGDPLDQLLMQRSQAAVRASDGTAIDSSDAPTGAR